MRVTDAWQRTTGGGVVVAVIDVGVDIDHPDMLDNTIPGRNFIACGDAGCGNGDWELPDSTYFHGSPVSQHFHGTHMAGIIGAVAGNGIGVAGVAPDADVLSVRVFDEDLVGFADDIGRGIRWAADHGADVINLSIGQVPGTQVIPLEDNRLLEAAVAYANQLGVVLVGGAGNDFASLCTVPAWLEGVLCVSGTTRLETRPSYTNTAIKPGLLSVAAPGGEITVNLEVDCGSAILSTMPVGVGDPGRSQLCGYPAALGYGEWQGTSQSTAHASGVAALLVAMGCTREQTLDLLTSTARKPHTNLRGVWDPQFGYGIVDADAATTRAEQLCAVDPDANRRPVAVEDLVTVDRGVPTTIQVLANDTDPENDPLTLISAGGGAHGRVTVDSGTVVYEPTDPTAPSDVFRYAVEDDHGNVTGGTVRLTFTGEPPVPLPSPVVLHFHGTRQEGCTGLALLDTYTCEGPFLLPEDDLDPNGIGIALPNQPIDDTVPRSLAHAHWTWYLDEPVRLAGTATIDWWASCPSCVFYGSDDWVIRLWVDGSPVDGAHVMLTRDQPTQQLSVSFDIGSLLYPYEATSSVAITLDLGIFLPDQATLIYYDSELACPGTPQGPCDSVLELPVIPPAP